MTNNSTFYWVVAVGDGYQLKGICRGNITTYPQKPVDYYSAHLLYLSFKTGEAIRSLIWDNK